MPDPSGNNQDPCLQAKEAARLAKLVVGFTLGGITILCGIVLWKNWGDKEGEMTRYVFASIIPLLGSWMGTVLAYYFSRENLAAATQSVRDLTQAVTGQDKLKAVLVKDKMIPFAQIESRTSDKDDLKLSDLMTIQRERIPIFGTNKFVRYLIYKAKINEYLATFAQGPTPGKLPDGRSTADATVNDLITGASPGDKKLFTGGFGFVRLDGTLADAKAAMDSVQLDQIKCADVFVTTSGTKGEAVVGWITDDTIVQNSKV